ncbi:MAG: LytTR family DNA-binding domain-containing protein [Methylococcales bacterium]
METNPKRRVVIVDDNPVAISALNDLLRENHPDLDVADSFENAISALPVIESGKVEGVFLDINFEQQGKTLGLELADHFSQLPHAPWVIFVTGYSEHAPEVIDLDLLNYGFIVKPINELKLAAAINRVIKKWPRTPPNSIEVHYPVFIPSESGSGSIVERVFTTRFLVPKEIKYVQSNQGVNTVKVYLLNGEVLDHVTLRLNQWLNFNLPCFVQISKNTIVHLKYVNGFKLNPSRFDAHLLTFRDNSTELPIGNAYFAALKETLRIGRPCCE